MKKMNIWKSVTWWNQSMFVCGVCLCVSGWKLLTWSLGAYVSSFISSLFHYLSTSAPNVLFMLRRPSSLLVFPTLFQCPTHHHPEPQLYTRGFVLLLATSYLPTAVMLSGSQRRRPHPLSPLAEVETDQQRSTSPPASLRDRAENAKWLTTVWNYCHIRLWYCS